MKTNKPIPKTLWGSEFVIPEGTPVQLVKGASGTQGDLYAVTSVALLIKLTGNSHDPKYRYCFVDRQDLAE